MRSLLCNVSFLRYEGISVVYVVLKIGEEKIENEVTYFSDGVKASCSCFFMKFYGILCLHILALLRFFGCSDLPNEYIMNRWRRGIKDGIKVYIFEKDIGMKNIHRVMHLMKMSKSLINDAASNDSIF